MDTIQRYCPERLWVQIVRKASDQTDGTRVNAVMQTIREQLASRVLVPGERLPSIRQMAERLNVAKNTIVEAYDRLAADGVIAAKRSSGFYVCGHLPPLSLVYVGATRGAR